MTNPKISDHHLSRQAYVYVRQSTPGQVRFNQESTERQYNLAGKAQSLGWSPERIRTLDRDLGQSGARMTGREDFKALVSDVALGQVGAIFSLEASRLARSTKTGIACSSCAPSPARSSPPRVDVTIHPTSTVALC